MPHPDLKDIRRVAHQTHSSGSGSPSGTGLFVLCMFVCMGLFAAYIFNQSSNYYVQPQASQILMMPVASRKSVSTPVLGTWKGKHFGKDAALHINHRRGNQFGGELVVHASKGLYRISIHGVLVDQEHLAFQEKKVLQKPAGANWKCGVNIGSFSLNHRRISGNGSDAVNPPYTWWFLRTP